MTVLPDEAVQQLAFQGDQVRVAQAVLHFLNRYDFGCNGIVRLCCLPENGIVQHRKKILNVRKTGHLNHVAHRHVADLPAFDPQPAGIVLKEQFLSGSLKGDPAFDMNPLGWLFVFAILCDIIDGQQRLGKRID